MMVAHPVFISAAYSAQPEVLNLQLSNEMRRAVDAGIILQFDCTFAKRNTWWQSVFRNENKKHQFQLMRHALSKRFLVRKDAQTVPATFRSIGEAMNFIAAQTRALLETYSSTNEPYSLRVSLNKYRLPAPMRLKAFIAGEWELDTGWIVWTSAN